MDVEWLRPWRGVSDPTDALAWARELKRECSAGHLLHGQDATFIARRQDRDDFLVLLADGRVAEVHLTWSEENDPRWPAAKTYETLAMWRDEVMEPDHRDWEE